ncbi:hypothetical protein [Spongiibacter sp.]|uniref:hypothetical protein n=1 Tax=Spongiibacter sp. TaxID=2024860 RepID=UPI003566F656
MKKFPLAVAGFCAFMTAGYASAVTTDLAAGNNAIILTDCPLLANDITLVLSNNVVGSLACEPTTSVAAISVCHTKGQKSSRSAVVTLEDDGVTVKCTVSETETCIESVSGSTFPTASTGSGQVTQQYPDTECSQTAVTAVANAQAPAPTAP